MGKLIVISGPSGVGKGTALELAMKERPDLSFSVSATTRAPRPNEVEGVSYDFITVEQFRRMIDENAFLEYDNHNETYYGTPRAQLEEKRAKGPSLERRLRDRKDTSEEQIKIRMARAEWEIEQSVWYDYVVVNQNVHDCAREILKIIEQ